MRSSARPLVVAVGAMLAVTLVLVLWSPWRGSSPQAEVLVPAAPVRFSSTAEPSRVEAAPAASPASRILSRWDARRARAYARADPAALWRLYAEDSAGGRADVSLMRSYRRRGFRVVGLRMQLLEVRVVRHAPRRWLLRVTDRVHAAVAVADDGRRLELPRDAATTRVVALRRSGTGWKVVEVRRSTPPRDAR